MTKISMDIKHMPASHGYSLHLGAIVRSVKLYGSITLTLYKDPPCFASVSKGFVAYFGPPTHIVCDQDMSFTSSLMHAFTEAVKYQSDICESHKS